MAISLIKQNGVSTYGVCEFVVDNATDLENINIKDILAGSTVYVIETKKLYMLDSNKEWKEM